jgi:hypothetical protein
MILRYVKDPCGIWQRYFAGKINGHFSPSFTCFAIRCLQWHVPKLWWMNQEQLELKTGTHNRSENGRRAWDACTIPPRNSNLWSQQRRNSKKTNWSKVTENSETTPGRWFAAEDTCSIVFYLPKMPRIEQWPTGRKVGPQKNNERHTLVNVCMKCIRSEAVCLHVSESLDCKPIHGQSP